MLRFVRAIAGFLIALVIVPLVPVLGWDAGPFAATAQAQETGKPKTLLELLRGDRGSSPSVTVIKPRTNRSTRSRRTSRVVKRLTRPDEGTSAPPPAAAAAAAPSGPVEKHENARVVLVVGDFIAGGMAQGLKEAFDDVSSVSVVVRANGSSGLVRDDYYNWPGSIGAIIEEISPSMVVVLLGSNDRQAMRVGGRSVKVRSDSWNAEYVGRVERMAKAVTSTNTPLVWVGGPPFRFKGMSTDILAFNEMYRTATEAVGGSFVDIWDGFVDANGAFAVRGSDINGRNVRLRASDGINFSKAGKRKLAFYVERQIRQMLGDLSAPSLATLAPESFSTMRLPQFQSETELVRFNPIRLDDPELDGGSSLLGDVTAPEPELFKNPLEARSAIKRLVQDGVPPPAQPGRANDFRWTPEADPPEG
ncbi:DUF459 domain-containing protein [Oricola sp.]|uniref:SGNH/GDSL hydrolase family protein n=1 Tax=Oricola sp. TaxID=1979950 RepID=UPI003BA9E7DB